MISYRNRIGMGLEALESRRLLASVSFQFDPPAGTSNPHKLEFDLDSPSIPGGAFLILTNDNTGEQIVSSMTTGMWGGGASAIFTFPSYSSGVLPDGNYSGALFDGSNQMILPANFFVFGGDANHDRAVDVTDLGLLASNWQGTGKTFSQADFNYDGRVDVTDLGILATKWQQSLAAVPTPPTGLTVSYFSTTQLNLDWADNSEPGVKYNVYRSTDPNFVPDPSNRVAQNLVSSSLSDTGLTPATRYYYAVTAVNGLAESYQSDPVQQVTGINLQPDGLQTSVVDDTSIDFYWNDKSANETGFTAELFDGSGNLISSQSLPADATSYEFTGLSPETDYGFAVEAAFPVAAPLRSTALHNTHMAVAQPVFVDPVLPKPALGPLQLQPQVVATTRATDEMVGLIILINGHFQNAGPGTGMHDLLNALRAETPVGGGHYRIIEGAEFVFSNSQYKVTWNGAGTLLDRADQLLDGNSIRDVAVVGYSHGAGVIDDFVRRLVQSRPLGVIWGMRYTAGIDSIERIPVDNFPLGWPATNYPTGSEFHHNFYGSLPWNPFTNPLKGSPINGAVNTPVAATHHDIQSDAGIRATIVSEIHGRITM